MRSMFCIPNESRAHAGLWSASSECIKSVPRSKGPAFIQAHVSVAERLWRALEGQSRVGTRAAGFSSHNPIFLPFLAQYYNFLGHFLDRRQINTVHYRNSKLFCSSFLCLNASTKLWFIIRTIRPARRVCPVETYEPTIPATKERVERTLKSLVERELFRYRRILKNSCAVACLAVLTSRSS